jgi:hypothetical protein
VIRGDQIGDITIELAEVLDVRCERMRGSKGKS